MIAEAVESKQHIRLEEKWNQQKMEGGVFQGQEEIQIELARNLMKERINMAAIFSALTFNDNIVYLHYSAVFNAHKLPLIARRGDTNGISSFL